MPIDGPCSTGPEQPCVERLPVTFCWVAARASAENVTSNRSTKNGTGNNPKNDLTGNRLTHSSAGNRLTVIAERKPAGDVIMLKAMLFQLSLQVSAAMAIGQNGPRQPEASVVYPL